ncbi:hypothetical protein CICLE_v10020887mg [Citrus x clementina]|uniref:Uncharacterized protein n=2 Tax=Citrus TaxID=2706 RepID=A0A067D9B6_CITSI|nr:hypothetical protein CICLE_v10020887mg [Citrus x clementina]KDO39594.1 hypothetical protein CISIN_1g042448mg [Citrus sinensis]
MEIIIEAMGEEMLRVAIAVACCNEDLKTSRNGSSQKANVKESSYENFGEMIRLMIIAMIIVTFNYYIGDFNTSRNGSSINGSLHEANVKESSYENFPLLWRMDRVNVYTELLEFRLDKPQAVERKNSRKWPDTLPQVDKLLVHVNGWPDLKPYNMFGTTAFRSQPHWGDNGGEKHILPGDHQSHDYSVISPNSVPLASRSSSCASSKDGDGDKQPPPNRSPPYGVASSQSEGQLCFPSLDMICLFLGAEVCVAAPLIRYKAGTSLSEAAKTLLFVAKILGFAGFLLCLGACIVQRSRRASRMMTAMGCAASFCGFLSILGMLFPENLMIWLIGALCVLPISAIPFAFKRSV